MIKLFTGLVLCAAAFLVYHESPAVRSWMGDVWNSDRLDAIRYQAHRVQRQVQQKLAQNVDSTDNDVEIPGQQSDQLADLRRQVEELQDANALLQQELATTKALLTTTDKAAFEPAASTALENTSEHSQPANPVYMDPAERRRRLAELAQTMELKSVGY